MWVGLKDVQCQQDCLYILSKTEDTHVTQLSCSKHTYNDAVRNQKRCILVQQYAIE